MEELSVYQCCSTCEHPSLTSPYPGWVKKKTDLPTSVFILLFFFFAWIKCLVGPCEWRKWAAVKTTASQTGSLHIWLKDILEISRLPSADTCLVIAAHLAKKAHLGPIVVYLELSCCWCRHQRGGLSSGWRARCSDRRRLSLRKTSKTTSWIRVNEEPVDFKGQRGGLSLLCGQENGSRRGYKEDIKEGRARD